MNAVTGKSVCSVIFLSPSAAAAAAGAGDMPCW